MKIVLPMAFPKNSEIVRNCKKYGVGGALKRFAAVVIHGRNKTQAMFVAALLFLQFDGAAMQRRLQAELKAAMKAPKKKKTPTRTKRRGL